MHEVFKVFIFYRFYHPPFAKINLRLIHRRIQAYDSLKTDFKEYLCFKRGFEGYSINCRTYIWSWSWFPFLWSFWFKKTCFRAIYVTPKWDQYDWTVFNFGLCERKNTKRKEKGHQGRIRPLIRLWIKNKVSSWASWISMSSMDLVKSYVWKSLYWNSQLIWRRFISFEKFLKMV